MAIVALALIDVNDLLSVPWWLYLLAIVFAGGEWVAFQERR